MAWKGEALAPPLWGPSDFPDVPRPAHLAGRKLDGPQDDKCGGAAISGGAKAPTFQNRGGKSAFALRAQQPVVDCVEGKTAMAPAIHKFEPRTSPGGIGLFWIILPALVVGYLGCQLLFDLATHFHNSELVIMLGAVAGLPSLVVVALALRQGIAYARSFVPTLR